MNSISHSINDYIKLFQAGQEEGFNYFFNAYYKRLHFFALGYVKDESAAEDIITDSFIKLWEKREKFESEAGLKAYLYKIVHNACLRWLEQKQGRAVHLASYAKSIEIAEEPYLKDIIKAETIALLHAAIEQLPTQCRNVFTKLYVEGKSVKEAAKEMNIAISTVKNQKARGIKLLKPKFIASLSNGGGSAST